MFTDTHCHLNDSRYTDLDGIVKNFLDENVSLVINAGYNIESSFRGAELSKAYDQVYFTAGIHPSDFADCTLDGLNKIKELSFNPKCVGIGEIGLDYHWDYDKKSQYESFLKQIDLAYNLNLPISIHSRDATEDMLNVLKNNKNKLSNGFIMHCFSGSRETAKILLDLGGYISFAGTLTFKNANSLLEVAKYVPEDKMLTETDSPYLSPHPFRGKTNEPKMVTLVVEKLAELKNLSVEQVAYKVRKNTLNLYKKIIL